MRDSSKPISGEPTSGLEPLSYSLRVIIHTLQEVAGVCKTRISKGVSFLRLTLGRTVLRSRWYQSGINRGIAPSQSCSLAHASEVRPAPRRHTSLKLTLDRYSHWMHSMGWDTADGMDEALGKATYSCPSPLLGGVSGRSHSET
jgi:hypothetical protein